MKLFQSHDTSIERFDDTPVAPTLARLGHVRLEQDPVFQDLVGGMTAFTDQRFEQANRVNESSRDVAGEKLVIPRGDHSTNPQ